MSRSQARACGPLTKALELLFDGERRRRGAQYVERGSVEIWLTTSRAILACVSGTERYYTSIKFKSGVVELACDCPFAERGQPCKHLWAVAVTADVVNAVSAVAREPVHRARLTDVDEMFEDDPAVDNPPEDFAGADLDSPGEDWRAILAASDDARRLAESAPRPRARSGRDLVYVLDPHDVLTTNRVLVHLWLSPHDRKAALPTRVTTPVLQALEPLVADALLLSLAASSPALGPQAVSLPLPQRGLSALVHQLCETGRFCYWPGEARGIAKAPRLRWDGGAGWRLRLDARPRSGGLVVEGTLIRRGRAGSKAEEERPLRDATLVLSGGLVFWPDCVGSLECRRPGDTTGARTGIWEWITALRASDTVTVAAEDVESFLDAFLSRDSALELRLPEAVCFERCSIEPGLLFEVSAPEPGKPLTATLSMIYGNRQVEVPHSEARVADVGQRKLYDHDLARERSAFELLGTLGVQRSSGRLSLAASRLPSVVRRLLAEGWEVRAQGKRCRTAGDFNIRVGSGTDWFEMHGGAQFGDQRLGLPELLAALRKGQDTVVLGDGSVGVLPEAWLGRLGLLAAAIDVDLAKPALVRVPRSQLMLVNALVEESPGSTVDAAFEQLRKRLTDLAELKSVEPPRGFEGTLRPYQGEGVAWMQRMLDLGFGCCLADEMGLGKTVQVLTLLLLRRRKSRPTKLRTSKPSLVIAPRAVLFNWLEEARRFTPSLRVAVHAGVDRDALESAIAEADLVISTYGLLRAQADQFAAAEFDTIVLDEAQAIKNYDTVTAEVARSLRGRHRVTLTGTPIENHLGELCSQLEFLNPGMFKASAAVQRALSGDPASADSLALIQRASRPFLLRRTKRQVARELPDRIERTVFVELEGAERRRYDELLEHYRDRIKKQVSRVGLARSTPTVLEALLRLRQAACHPGLLDARRANQPSAKLARLLEDLEQVAKSRQKALVFSQFTTLLGIVKTHLQRRRISFEYLDGATLKREERVARFQSDASIPVFLISLKAGGVGMNLTAAEHVFLLDPWWNPAVEAQAIDRTHRIGQHRQISAYKLIARRTVEEKVVELQSRKRELAAAILGQDAGLGAKLTREDLEALIG